VQAESAKKLKFDHGLVREAVVELGELAAQAFNSGQGSSNCNPARDAHRLGAWSYTQEEGLESDDDEQLTARFVISHSNRSSTQCTLGPRTMNGQNRQQLVTDEPVEFQK
jgi:hypothetical protein